MLGKDDQRNMILMTWTAPKMQPQWQGAVFSTEEMLCPGGSSMQPWEQIKGRRLLLRRAILAQTQRAGCWKGQTGCSQM